MILERLILIFPSDMARVAEVGARARAFCERGAASDDDAAQIELCVVEAVNNAIEHACGSRPDHQIALVAMRSVDALFFEVSDRGEPMPAGLLEAHAEGRLKLDPRDVESLPERGFGLAIIKQVMDEVSYRSDLGINTLRLVFRLPHCSSIG